MAREMKYSGIEWIGIMPQNWKVISFWQATERMATGLNPRDNFELTKDDEYFYVTIRNFKNGKLYLDNNCDRISAKAYGIIQQRSQLQKGDILFASISETGNAYILENNPDNWNINESVFTIRPDKNRFIEKFFYYHLINEGYYSDLRMDATGSTFQSIKQNKLRKSRLVMPPLPEQQKIAAFLDIECAKIDDVITKTKATIEEYKKLKQSVITEAVTKGIRPDREMKDNCSVWFNNIPSDWDCQKLKFVFHIQKDIAGEEGYTVLSITQKGIIPKDLSKNEGQLAQNYSNYQFVHIGDFAMNHMDLLTGWVDISKYEGVTSPDYRVFVLNDTENNSRNYYLYMMQMCYSNKIFYGLGQGVSGFGRWRLQADKFLNFYIPIPPYEEQQEIADYLDKKCSEIDTLIAKKEQIVTELESYKKSLIYEYVTGKREICDMNEKEEIITIFNPQATRLMQEALAYKVIRHSGDNLKGRIHLMKIIYMLDSMLGLDLGINYLRYTRGPYNPIIESIEKNLSDKGIISINTAKKYSYTVIDDSFDIKYNELFAKHNFEIEKIIDYMKRMKSSRAEKIATLYAAWNDMIIDGVQNITDKMIIDDVMNNWTENKANTDFSTWQHILNEMKDKKIIPRGYGKHTIRKSE